MKQYLWNFLVWLDYTINDKWLHGHWESISSRTYRNHKRYRFCYWLMKGLDKVDPGHCRRMYLKDKAFNPSIPDVPWEV